MKKTKKQLKCESEEHFRYAKKYRSLYVSKLTEVAMLEKKLAEMQAELSKFQKCSSCTDFLVPIATKYDVYHKSKG